MHEGKTAGAKEMVRIIFGGDLVRMPMPRSLPGEAQWLRESKGALA